MWAGVDSVPEHGDLGQVALDAGEVLHVVEPSGHVGVLLPLLDGQVHLRGGVEAEMEHDKILFSKNGEEKKVCRFQRLSASW